MSSLRTLNADTLLVLILAFPFHAFDSYIVESQLGELTDRVLLTCCNHEVLWFLSLENQPHTLYIILGITPQSRE